MDVRQIKTEEDYDAALAEIDRLMGSPHGSRDGESLKALVILVEAYEAKHWPIDPPDPSIGRLKPRVRWSRKRSLDDQRTSH